jgi:hypothetical protein
MPRWLFSNTGMSSVPLPAPLQGTVRPRSNLTIETEAVNVDTPIMRELINSGVIQVALVKESRRISNSIEVPVVDFINGQFLSFRGEWSGAEEYLANDLVQYGNKAWVALLPSTGAAPTEGALWTSLVDAGSLIVKDSVAALGNFDVNLNGLVQTLDDVAIDTDGMRVLLTNQTDPDENGIWVAHAGVWTRPDDFATGSSAASAFTFVEQGTAFGDSGWVCVTDSPIDVVDTNPLAFTQFSGAGQVIAGAGLTKTGNTINVIANADGSIVVNANDIQVGVLATDAQHGNRGGGSLHALAVPAGDAGFISGADKFRLDGLAEGGLLIWGNTSVGSTVTTRFLTPGFSSSLAPTSVVQFRAPFAGTLSHLRVRHNVTAGNGNNIVYTLRVNGVDTPLTVAVPSTSSDGNNLVDETSVNAGDLLDIEVTKAASIGASPTDVTASIEITA